jgi:hypothetical protein
VSEIFFVARPGGASSRNRSSLQPTSDFSQEFLCDT